MKTNTEQYTYLLMIFLAILGWSACAPHFPQVRKGEFTGTLAFWSSHESGLVIASADGSWRKKINEKCRQPIFFPDGQHFLCSDWTGNIKFVLNKEGNVLKTIYDDTSFEDISPDGRYVLGSDGPGRTLLVFELESSRIIERISPAELMPDVLYAMYHRWSRRTAEELYAIVSSDPDRGPFWLYKFNVGLRIAKKMFQFPSASRGHFFPSVYSFDPDEERIAFKLTLFPPDAPSRESHLYVSNVDGTDVRQITSGRRRYYGNPQWSPDGKLLLAEDNTQGHKLEGEAAVLLLMNPDGSNQRRIFKRPGLFFESNDADARWCPR